MRWVPLYLPGLGDSGKVAPEHGPEDDGLVVLFRAVVVVGDHHADQATGFPAQRVVGLVDRLDHGAQLDQWLVRAGWKFKGDLKIAQKLDQKSSKRESMCRCGADQGGTIRPKNRRRH